MQRFLVNIAPVSHERCRLLNVSTGSASVGVIAELDFALIAMLAVREDQHEALRELRGML